MLETFLSGRQLHGHARRDELPARRGRPGQGARGPGRRGPRDAAEPPPDGRRGPRGRRTRSARRRRSRSRSSTSASRSCKAAQAHLKALETAGRGRARAPKRAQYARMAADEKRMRQTLAATAAAKRQLQHKINRLVAAAVQPGQHPVAVQRDAALADGRRRDPGLRLHRASCTSRRWATAPTGTTASTSSPRTAPRSTRRAPGRVVYVGWNYADGADPAWIVIIAHSQSLSTWYAHMQSRYKVRAGQARQPGPGHRLRGQHRPLDRRPPPLDGRVQRELREPPAVHLAVAGPRAGPTADRRSPARC